MTSGTFSVSSDDIVVSRKSGRKDNSKKIRRRKPREVNIAPPSPQVAKPFFPPIFANENSGNSPLRDITSEDLESSSDGDLFSRYFFFLSEYFPKNLGTL